MRMSVADLRRIIKEEARRVALFEMPGRAGRSGEYLHGLRHGQRLEIKGEKFIADTKSDDSWVLLNREDGSPYTRQSKKSVGRRHRQGTNPDYEGSLVYPLQYWRNGAWHSWNTDAPKGEIRYFSLASYMRESTDHDDSMFGRDPYPRLRSSFERRQREMSGAKCSVCFAEDAPGNHLRKVYKQSEGGEVFRCTKHVNDY